MFDHKGKDVVAAAGKDGRIYLLDSTSMQTPLAVSPAAAGEPAGGALASWQDAQGTRWILLPTAGAVETGCDTRPRRTVQSSTAPSWPTRSSIEGGALALQPGWISAIYVAARADGRQRRGLRGVEREYRPADPKIGAAQRAQRSTPAVLYALDGATGKELWNSGKTITSFARSGLSGGAGVVYIPTYDSTLYAFGVPIEK